MLYKFINERKIEQAPPYIKENGIVTSNPTEAKLRELGYKDLVKEPYPEISEDCYRIPFYIDGDVITQKWSEEINKETETNENNIIQEE